MKRVLIVLLITITTLTTLIACGSKDDSITVIDKVEIDNNISKKQNINNIVNNTNKNEMIMYDDFGGASELVLINNDTSKDYEIINNNDIIYNGKQFNNLYSSIMNIDMPYDKNTFINFIIKTYTVDDNTIYSYSVYSNEIEQNENADSFETTMHEQLSYSQSYLNLCEKYNTEAQWELSIYTLGANNMISFYGCKDFVVLKGTYEKLCIDVETYEVYKGDN